MAEQMTPLDHVFDILFFRWWGALIGGLALFALAYLLWPGPPPDPDNARAFKGSVRMALLSGASGVCAVGMIVVAARNLFGKAADESTKIDDSNG